jgi:hypothetical protein
METDDTRKTAAADIRERLFGDLIHFSDEELDALYEVAAPACDPRQTIYRAAEQAAVTYRKQQQLPPPHVQAALDASRTQTRLDGAKAALQRIVDGIKAPVLGPVGDPSFAFHKQTELTDDDRRLLDEQAKELGEDWEDKTDE